MSLPPPIAPFAAGAAYQVDTADVSEPGTCKVESWVSFAKNGDFIGSTSPDCVVSIFGKPVDISAQFSRFRSDDEWGTGGLSESEDESDSDRRSGNGASRSAAASRSI